MEGGSGSNHIDKSRVLDLKPLRTLKPVFTNGNQTPPFVCMPPFGPVPPGYTPFYPFSSFQADQSTPNLDQVQNPPQHQPQHQPQYQPQNQPLNPQQQQPLNPHQPLIPQQQQPWNQPQQQPMNLQQHQSQNLQQQQSQISSHPSTVASLVSFETPGTSNGDIEPEGSSVKRKTPRKRTPPNKIVNYESGISVAERDNGNRDLVKDVLIRFDALRRRFFQLEDLRGEATGIIKRPDMKAGSICMSSGVRTNIKKRLGIVPGVEIGDIFYFRFEMCLVGLHSPSMAGIDYVVIKNETEEEPIATSIVSSGHYDNEKGNPDVLIYTGQGGKPDKDKQASDQKLERGNLALERSLHRNSVVRVIRGLKMASHDVKIYMYDGLYEIKESWVETGNTGHKIFKYKLVRAPEQPPAFATWTAVQKWKKGSVREGLILPDISAGVESIPVSLVNDVDTVTEPAYFTYSTTVRYSEAFKLAQASVSCGCGNSCKPGNLNCQCIRRNGGEFPYSANGVLVSRKPLVYECSPSCPCSTCKNKVTQMGVKVKLEVFKTVNRGWGLRSWDPIRAGSFICIYAGEAKDKSKVQYAMANDDYTFDTTRVCTPFKWNYEASLAEEDPSTDNSEEFAIPLPLIISAKNTGNVARFMNHSCSPNVFWQPVTYENNGQLCLQVAFFAISHIPPMTELTYDYGVSLPYGKKQCLCGSMYCRGSFG